ncbi:hypothetical protein MKW92_053057 [Papaver armeniacum]|nr:hypothetical protein MKW92_053057 [Papaver armeniacum]
MDKIEIITSYLQGLSTVQKLQQLQQSDLNQNEKSCGGRDTRQCRYTTKNGSVSHQKNITWNWKSVRKFSSWSLGNAHGIVKFSTSKLVIN